MLRWSLLMAGGLLVVQPVTQLAAIVYVLYLFGVGPWSKSFYHLNVEFFVWASIKLVIGLGFMAISGELFRRQKQMRTLTGAN